MNANTSERSNLFIKLVLVILGIALAFASWYRFMA